MLYNNQNITLSYITSHTVHIYNKIHSKQHSYMQKLVQPSEMAIYVPIGSPLAYLLSQYGPDGPFPFLCASPWT